jgi:hypothetical protein
LDEVSTGGPTTFSYEEPEDEQELWAPITNDETDYRPTEEEMQSHVLPPPIKTDISVEETDSATNWTWSKILELMSVEPNIASVIIMIDDRDEISDSDTISEETNQAHNPILERWSTCPRNHQRLLPFRTVINLK